MISVILCASMMAFQDFPTLAKPPEKRYVVLLNKGPKRNISATMPEKELAEMQSKHLANFTRLDGIKKLLFVGPLLDDGFIRGIIALKANSRSELKGYFDPDPFISNEILAIDAYEMSNAPWARIDESAETHMVSNTLVLMKKGKNWSKSKAAGPFAVVPSEAMWIKSGSLAFWSRLSKGSDPSIVALLYFHTKSTDEVKTLLAADPLLQSAVYVAETHPQFMASRFIGGS